MIHPSVFRDFKISVNKCYKVRGAYVCETGQGTKVIRRINDTPAQITLQYNIKEHLVNSGFGYVERLYLSKKNTPYTIYYNRLFIMTDWKKGSEVDFYSLQDINLTIRLLAKMHIAGKGFYTFDQDIKEVKIKNLGVTYGKRYKETLNLKKRIMNTGNKTEFEISYLENNSVYKELQEIALGLINKENYGELIQKARKQETIAHHQYTYYNIKKIRHDDVIISGFSRSRYDVQLVDLAYVTRRMMQKNNWDLELLFYIIEEYNKINPLSLKEWGIIKGMIIFPDKFSKLCNQYYYSKRRWNYNMFNRKFTRMLDYKDIQLACAKEILKW